MCRPTDGNKQDAEILRSLVEAEAQLDSLSSDIEFWEELRASNRERRKPLLYIENQIKQKESEVSERERHIRILIEDRHTWGYWQEQVSFQKRLIEELQSQIIDLESQARTLRTPEMLFLDTDQLAIDVTVVHLTRKRAQLYKRVKALRCARDSVRNEKQGSIRRQIQSPHDRMGGELYTRPCSTEEAWLVLGKAQGIVDIPANMDLLLDFTGQGADLRGIRDGDIQWIHVADHVAEFRIAPHIRHLLSVPITHGKNRDWMDHWLTLKKD